MNDEDMRARHEALLDRMCLAGWLSGYVCKDGQGYLLHWTPDGDSCAEQIKGLSSLYEVKQNPLDNFVTLPSGLAESLIWRRVVNIVETDGPPLTDYEIGFMFHVLVRWQIGRAS